MGTLFVMGPKYILCMRHLSSYHQLISLCYSHIVSQVICSLWQSSYLLMKALSLY